MNQGFLFRQHDVAEVFDLPEAGVELRRWFLPGDVADRAFATLRDATPWQRERIVVCGREVDVPRLTAWYGDPGSAYVYSGVRHLPLPWTALLSGLRERVGRAARARFNSVLLNYYRSGADSVAWHADDEPELGARPVIASLSLGATRTFQMKHNERSDIPRVDIELENGSLLTTSGDCQSRWKHRIPKRRSANAPGPRINLTFRYVVGVLALTCALFGAPPRAQDGRTRPNILWITSEDNAAHWLGCYGNGQARTPRLDRLAKHGLRFTAAYSNAPVCAVARSTILTGVYAPSQGTQHMRSRYTIPKRFTPYPVLLHKAGYWCTNRSKTDYNIKGRDKSYWDECGRRSHYRHRPAGKPFFAVFNLTVSHESSLFPKKVERMRHRGVIPKTPRIDPADVALPACVPDLADVRRDFAIYNDTMTALDTSVGKILDELERDGLAGETIVFYYADHGGPTPRGKRYLEDTGVRVPMLVRVPEKWRRLSPFAAGSSVTELVAFVDLAPTLLSLAGVKIPDYMQGRAFLGAGRKEPAARQTVFLFADRFDEIFGMRRGITDGRWKYIRRFTPYLPAAPYSYYQFSMPSWIAMRQAWRDGRLAGYHKALWESRQASDELFDTKNDPWEVHNLAAEPAQAERLAAMRAELKATMLRVHDTGVVPEAMFAEVAAGRTLCDAMRDPDFDYASVLDAAFATPGDAGGLGSKHPVVRYQALRGFLALGERAGTAKAAVAKLLADASAANRIMAARVLYVCGDTVRATQVLLAELTRDTNPAAKLLALNALEQIGRIDAVPDATRAALRKAGGYLKRFVERAGC